MLRSLELELPAVRDSVPFARHAVLEMLDGLGFDLWPVAIVVSEAVTNSVLHAYRHGETGPVRVQASLRATLLSLVVADDGVGMTPDPDSTGLGIGLGLIARLTDHMEVRPIDGTTLVLGLRLAATAIP